MDSPGDGSDFLIQLVPLTIAWLIFLVPAFFIAKRKGVSTTRFLIGAFPLWTGLFVLWWVSLTDKAVLDRLEQLERRA